MVRVRYVLYENKLPIRSEADLSCFVIFIMFLEPSSADIAEAKDLHAPTIRQLCYSPLRALGRASGKYSDHRLGRGLPSGIISMGWVFWIH